MGFTLSNSLLIGLAGLLCSATLAQDCTPRKPVNFYESMNFKEICGEKFPTGAPGFDRPIACSTKAVNPQLALSISNKAFQCNKWCVHSLESDVAWMWDPSQACWAENIGCLNFAEEKAFALKIKTSLCPDCVPVIKSSDLSVAVVKQKCPAFTENSVPSYHINKACEWDGPLEDLGLSLANGGYVGCDKWCVYSVRTPDQVAYKWNPAPKCWSIQNSCIASYPAERQAVEAIKAKLCQATCTAVRPASELTVDVVKMKCPSYAATSHPQFHNNKLCRTLEADPELGEALANHAYSSCTAWCLFSLRRPSAVSWKWMPDRLCWSENADCRAIQTEMTAAQALSATACIPPVPPSKDAQPVEPQQQSQQPQGQQAQPAQIQQQQQQQTQTQQPQEQQSQPAQAQDQQQQQQQQEEQQKRQQEEQQKQQQELEKQQEIERQQQELKKHEAERQEQERRRQEEEERAMQKEQEERERQEAETRAREINEQNLQQQQQPEQQQQSEQAAQDAKRQQIDEARQQSLKRRQEIADQMQKQNPSSQEEKPQQQQQQQQPQMTEEEKKKKEEKFKAEERHRKQRADEMIRRAQEMNRRENELKLKEREKEQRQANSDDSPRSWRTQHTTRTKDPADSFKLFGGLFLVFVAIVILAFFTKESQKPKHT